MGKRTILLAYLAIPVLAGALVAALCSVALYGLPSTEDAARAEAPAGAPAVRWVGRDRYEQQRRACGPGGERTIAYAGPTHLWPPDRARREAPVTASDRGGGTVRLTTRASSGVGAETLRAEGRGRAANVHRLRPKRAKLSYTVTARARWSDGSTCEAHFTAAVVHASR